jgi:hypothetical protein
MQANVLVILSSQKELNMEPPMGWYINLEGPALQNLTPPPIQRAN